MRGGEASPVIIERGGELFNHFFRASRGSFAYLLCRQRAFVGANRCKQVLLLAAARLPSPDAGGCCHRLLSAGGADLLVHAGAHIGRRL